MYGYGSLCWRHTNGFASAPDFSSNCVPDDDDDDCGTGCGTGAGAAIADSGRSAPHIPHVLADMGLMNVHTSHYIGGDQ